MKNKRFLWVVFPYVIVFWGMAGLNNAWGALIGFHVSLTPILFLNRRTIAEFFRKPVPFHFLFFVPVSGLVAGILLWNLWPSFGINATFGSKIESVGLTAQTLPIFILYISLINPIFEEAYWRLLGNYSAQSITWSDILFAGYHLIILSKFVGLWVMFAAFLVLTMAGWFWRLSLRYTHSLVPGVLAHLLADLSIMCAVYNNILSPN